MKAERKVLLINSHLTYPNWSEGTLNHTLQQKAKAFFEDKGFGILETKIEDGYHVQQEEQKHLDADIVVLQMPVNWFGAPWIYKKYVDEVFNHALFNKSLLSGDGRTREDPAKQYGTGGHMQGRQFMICATWNAPKEAFGNPDYELFSGKGIADIFLPITSNYRFCGYEVVESYNCFDIFKNPDLEKDLERYPAHLAKVFEL